jgi:hypothetical protein
VHKGRRFLWVLMGVVAGIGGAQIASAEDSTAQAIDSQARILSTIAQNLDPQVAKLSLESYHKARSQGLDDQQILTIVDYSKPSTVPRLWVFDLKTNELLYKTLVAHAKNSGENVPLSFSNEPQSLKSSVGLYLTGQPYQGHHGYSLRLQGLERGFNENAEARNIVVHAADYVSPQFAASHGRLGRSFGCFALSPQITKAVINTIKAGTLIFAYAPDKNWLSHSRYLT